MLQSDRTIEITRHKFVRPALTALALAGMVWGLWALGHYGAVRAGPDALSIAQTAAISTPDQEHRTAEAKAHEQTLPRAWLTPSATPSWTPTPSLTASPSPTATPTPTLSPTATATAPHTIPPSPTPIHLPANGDPTRIQAPAIGLDAPVIAVDAFQSVEGLVNWPVADYAAGFHRGTARPGYAGNTVLSGHNNIRGEVFRDLYKLIPGDAIYLWVGNTRYHYRVYAVYRLPIANAPLQVLRDNLRFLLPTEDQRLTLITCWPPWSNTHRVVVVAFPAPYEPSEGSSAEPTF
ncbi:MAG: sortase [Chloroflexi bacterium]|nr:sortase [Chloroflexota bacterium]